LVDSEGQRFSNAMFSEVRSREGRQTDKALLARQLKLAASTSTFYIFEKDFFFKRNKYLLQVKRG